MVRCKGMVFLGAIVAASFTVAGCGAAQRTKPHMTFGDLNIQTDFERDDVVVLDRVDGTSKTFTCLFGLIRVIDDEKLQLLGIKFFKDKYTYFRHPLFSWLTGATTADRAYYKTLESQDEADAILVKSWDNEDDGLPLIWHTKTITVRGKAVKFKPDSP